MEGKKNPSFMRNLNEEKCPCVERIEKSFLKGLNMKPYLRVDRISDILQVGC